MSCGASISRDSPWRPCSGRMKQDGHVGLDSLTPPMCPGAQDLQDEGFSGKCSRNNYMIYCGQYP